MKPPNILFIMTDQHQARSLSCLGHPDVKTPNLDQLAGRSVLFENTFCPSPICGPARTSVFTGLYPSATGALNNDLPYKQEVSVLLPERLRQAGYYTAMCGKLHLKPTADAHGFDEKHLDDGGTDLYCKVEPQLSEYVHWLADRRFDGDIDEVIRLFNEDEECLEEDPFRFIQGSNWRTDEEHQNTWVTERTLDVLREKQDQPLFLFSSFFGPHQPMIAPEPWASMYSPDDIELPPEYSISLDDKPLARDKVLFGFLREKLTEQQVRKALAAYYGQISMIDHCIGRILDELEAQGMADNTIIVFTADHGDHASQFGMFFKGTMYDNAACVPLMIADPGKAGGLRCPKNVNSLDLYATCLEAAGAEVPECHSHSLMPLLDDPLAPDWDNVTYSEKLPWNGVVRDHWKLVRYNDPEEGRMHELYDRRAPVIDSLNRWDDPEVSGIQASLLAELDRLEEATQS